ncbi:secreted ookinete protein [Plasmodium gonderi]|uniref:Secreted ookinete protein n=1 Tax=Plasmodium gonderi TaxID=77519 RepID=A0A1Y1J9A6_PLAGO|nr:secreted ookinete protein [Plasmodium gonderi]GAW79091.1 secreted ookinete protein [Plasmodium gonderi]
MKIFRILLISSLIAISSHRSDSDRKSTSRKTQKKKEINENNNGERENYIESERNHTTDEPNGRKNSKGSVSGMEQKTKEEKLNADMLNHMLNNMLDDLLDGTLDSAPRKDDHENPNDEIQSAHKEMFYPNPSIMIGRVLHFIRECIMTYYRNIINHIPRHDEMSLRVKMNIITILKSSKCGQHLATIADKLIAYSGKVEAQWNYIIYSPFGYVMMKKTMLDRWLEENQNHGADNYMKGEKMPKQGAEGEAENVEQGAENGDDENASYDNVDDDNAAYDNASYDNVDDDNAAYDNASYDNVDEENASYDNAAYDGGDENKSSASGGRSKDGIDPSEEENSESFLSFEKDFMKMEELSQDKNYPNETNAGKTNKTQGETDSSSHNWNDRMNSKSDGSASTQRKKKKGIKKNANHKEKKMKKKRRKSDSWQADATTYASIDVMEENDPREKNTKDEHETEDEYDDLLINKPESIKYFFELLSEICIIVKLGVMYRYTHFLIPLKNLIVSKTLHQIEVILMTVLSIHRIGSHKYRDVYGLGVIMVLLYVLRYFIKKYIFKNEKRKSEQENKNKQSDDIYVENLLKRILYFVENKKTMSNYENVIQDVLENTETLLANSAVINKENKQIYNDIISNINNLGIFTYLSTQALKSINQKSNVILSELSGDGVNAARMRSIDMEMNLDLDLDLDVLGANGQATNLGSGIGPAMGTSLRPTLAPPGGVGIEGRGRNLDDNFNMNKLQNNYINERGFEENSGSGKLRYSLLQQQQQQQQHNDAYEEGDHLFSLKKTSTSYGLVSDNLCVNNGGNNFIYNGISNENGKSDIYLYSLEQPTYQNTQDDNCRNNPNFNVNMINLQNLSDIDQVSNGLNTPNMTKKTNRLNTPNIASTVVNAANFSNLGPPPEYVKFGDEFPKGDMDSGNGFSHMSKMFNPMNGEDSTIGASRGVPTGAQSCVPSDIPSEIPNGAPSEIPNGAPSEIPNGAPSEIPNGAPSEIPNGAPSEIPNGAPSEIPNDAPSEITSEDGIKGMHARSRANQSPKQSDHPIHAMMYVPNEQHIHEMKSDMKNIQNKSSLLSTSPMGNFIPDLNNNLMHLNNNVQNKKYVNELIPKKKSSAGLNTVIPEKSNVTEHNNFPVHGNINRMKLPSDDSIKNVDNSFENKKNEHTETNDKITNNLVNPNIPLFDDSKAGGAISPPPRNDSLPNYAPQPFSQMPPAHKVMESSSNRNQKYLTQRKERQKIVATKSPFN